MLLVSHKTLLALDRFLGELSDVQIVIVVHQRRLKTLEEAVVTVLEMESYVAQGKGETKISVVEVVDKYEETCEVQPDVRVHCETTGENGKREGQFYYEATTGAENER